MARDYFQDITPPGEDPRPRPAMQDATPPAAHGHTPEEYSDSETAIPIKIAEDTVGARGIRTIAPTRPMRTSRYIGSDMRPGAVAPKAPRPSVGGSRRWLWGVAILAVIALLALLLLALRSTTVTVTPKSQLVTFDSASKYTAYPSLVAPAGALTYTVRVLDLDDTATVPAQGVTQAQTKASGSITVFNAYSTSPVTLVKTTRFQTPGGLIFRTPSDVVVPAMKGGVPGQVKATVVADQPGETYNVAAVNRFSLPGLKSNAAMYAHVYASSAAAMTGGASGNVPAMAAGAEDAARAQIRTRLETKVNNAVATLGTSSVIALPTEIEYQSLPNTSAANSVVIHESAHADIILLPEPLFAKTIAQSVSADAGTSEITLIPGSGFAISAQKSGWTPGTDPLSFSITGKALLVWKVDAEALAQALASRNETAFQTIVASFPGVQEAHARIEPFWKSSFPKASSIRIKVLDLSAN